MGNYRLKGHQTNINEHDISCEIERTLETINFNFKLTGYDAVNNGKGNRFNWGLWEEDVVEVFLQKKGSRSYLELQLSPKSDVFALIVEKPREKFYFPQKLNIKTNVSKGEFSLEVPIKDIPGEGDMIMGNCFACLGQKQQSYYALNINTEKAPDFHRPDLFVELK